MDRWRLRVAKGMVPSLLVAALPGCSGERPAAGMSPPMQTQQAGQPSPKPVRAALRATQGELGKQLAVMNGLSALQNGADPRILGELLTATLEHRASVVSDSAKPWIQRLTELSSDAWVRGSAGLFESDMDRVLERVQRFELEDEQPALNSLNLLRELETFRKKAEDFGTAVAERELVERLEGWAPEIFQAANTVYLEADAEVFRRFFQTQIQKPLEKASHAAVRVDASLAELSQLVPGEVPEIVRLKEALGNDLLEKAKKLSSSERTQKALELAQSTFQWVNTVSESVRLEKDAPRANRLQRRAEVAVRLAGLFAEHVLKRPEVARNIETIGGAVVRLAGLVRHFKAGDVGSQLLTGNFLGAAKHLLEGFGVLSAGGDQQAVLSAIEGIQKSLSEFRAEMNRRLDGIDQKLDGITGKLDQQLLLLKEQKIEIHEIQKELEQIDREIRDLGVLIQTGLNDQYEQNFKLKQDSCLGGFSKVEKLSDAALSECLNYFYDSAVHFSNQESRGSIPVKTPDLYLALRRGEREFRLGGYALGYQMAGFDVLLESQSNIMDWVRSSEVLHLLLLQQTSGLDQLNPKKLDDLVGAGKKIRRTLQWMGRTSTLARVLEQYDRSVQAAIESDPNEGRKQWVDRARVARALLDQSLQLTRPEDRMGRADLVRLFESETEGFPGESALLEFLRKRQDGKELARSKNAAVAAFKVYLDGREQGSAREVSSTLVDDSLARLEQLIQTQKSKRE